MTHFEKNLALNVYHIFWDYYQLQNAINKQIEGHNKQTFLLTRDTNKKDMTYWEPRYLKHQRENMASSSQVQ